MKYILTFLLILLTSFSYPSSIVEDHKDFEIVSQTQGFMYRDLGYFNYPYADGTYIKMRAYIWKQPNRSGYYPQFKYEYVLVAQSESWNGVRVTETWLYNNRIYYNGNEISYNQFPNGLTTYVATTPTSVYSWFTSDENIGNFSMSWGSSAYENR